MDGKVAAILVLSILILLIAFFGIFLYTQTIQDQQRQIGELQDFTLQEKKVKKIDRTRLSKQKTDSEKKTVPGIDKSAKKLQKAVLLYETEQYNQALQLFADLKINAMNDETSAAAYYYMAATLHQLGKDKKALNFLKRITGSLKQTKWTTKAVILLSKINRKFQYTDRSLEVYLHKLYMETSSLQDQQQILTQLGYLKLYRDDLSGAMDHFQKANTVLGRLGQARVHIRKNQYWKAISIYEDILKYPNLTSHAYYTDVKKAFLKQTYYYAKRWLKNNSYDHAYFYFRKIVNFFPNSLYGEASLFWLGEMFQMRKKYKTAIRYYDLTLSNSNKNKDDAALLKRGIAFYKLNRYARSIKDFKKLITFHTQSPYLSRAKQWISMAERELTYR